MMNSTMQSKPLRVIFKIGTVVFWLGIWEIIALIVNDSYFMPTVEETVVKLFSLLISSTFLLTVSTTLLRVLMGLVFGIILGTLVSLICYKFPAFNDVLAPIITIIKSTPVASFVIILWVMPRSGWWLPVIVAFLMVMPIVWQNLMDGYKAIDNGLIEVANIFSFSFRKRLKLLVAPTLKSYLLPAIITASGLAWKSEIAAEIITSTTDSIGEKIQDARSAPDTPLVFAWTIIIIVLSIVLEKALKYLLSKTKSAAEKEKAL